MAEPRDFAIGAVLAGTRGCLAAGRVAVLPVRVTLRLPVVGPPMRRRTDQLALEGQGARLRAREELESVAAAVLTSKEVERVAARVLERADLDRVISAVLDHERTQQLIASVLSSPGLERLIVQVLESRLVDDLTERVLHSPEMERVVEYVATSPQVLDAVTRQTRSLADDMAANVRRRAESADDVAERTVRSWLRRPRPGLA
jgi:hypothetical protein